MKIDQQLTNQEPIEFEVAYDFAETKRRKAIASIPEKLQTKEDNFAEKLRASKIGPLKKLEMLYQLMSDLTKELVPHIPCKKGCSACCYYEVSISEIEVAYIEKHTKHRSLKKLHNKQIFHGQPCPFLKGGTCSIYEARPFVCRRHHAFTPNAYWCHHERSGNREHGGKEFPLIKFTSVDQAFDDIRLESNPAQPMDIRQYFGEQIDV